MKILCSKTISPELMNKFKEDLRFIFRKHGHSMGNFNPKKTYGAAVYCKLRCLKSDIPSFEEDLLVDGTEEEQDELWDKYYDHSPDLTYTVKHSGNTYYFGIASRKEINEYAKEQLELIRKDFMKLDYAQEMQFRPTELESTVYLYPSSNVPETAYKNDYVILSGPLHFYIDPNYEV